jgi:hypothetical protein
MIALYEYSYDRQAAQCRGRRMILARSRERRTEASSRRQSVFQSLAQALRDILLRSVL